MGKERKSKEIVPSTVLYFVTGPRARNQNKAKEGQVAWKSTVNL